MAENDKKLKRLPKQGLIAGVCAGLADYFDIDVSLVRLVFILLAVVTGGGMIIAYIVMALVIPADQTPVTGASTEKTIGLKHNAQILSAEMHENGRTERMRNYIGAGIILIGIWLLLGELFPIWFTLRWDYVWPIVLIIVGLIIATKRRV